MSKLMTGPRQAQNSKLTSKPHLTFPWCMPSNNPGGRLKASKGFTGNRTVDKAVRAEHLVSHPRQFPPFPIFAY
jgi:hypothetical protein